MKYGLYIRKPGSTKTFKRHCKIDYNRKGLLTAYPITYASKEDVEFEADLMQAAGYETQIKEVKA